MAKRLLKDQVQHESADDSPAPVVKMSSGGRKRRKRRTTEETYRTTVGLKVVVTGNKLATPEQLLTAINEVREAMTKSAAA